MGFLTDMGEVLNYNDSIEYQFTQKREAVKQFQRIYDKFFDKKIDSKQLLWGDEIEYQIVKFDHKTRTVRLQCNTQYILDAHKQLNQKEYLNLDDQNKQLQWNNYFQSMVEYGSWMIETIPMEPYQGMCNMHQVRQNLRVRNKMLRMLCKEDEVALCMTHFPLIGMPDSYIQNTNMQPKQDDDEKTKILKDKIKQNLFGQSKYFDDETITNHPRFRYMAQNIRERRGEHVQVTSGVFQDKYTKEAIHTVDHMGFGMGMGCLQQTFATLDIDTCRHMYDQLSIFSPIMLAFTAATPILHGRLIDQDTRWNMLAQSVDCRNQEERDKNGESYLPKSRYDSISHFIGNTKMFRQEYNDIHFNINLEPVSKFRKNSQESGTLLDHNLQSHLGFLLARDSVVMFKKEIDSQNFDNSFEQFNSTNWNNVRFKPQPNLDANDMAWRIEFRTMEIQPTETENLNALFIVKLLANSLMYSQGDNNQFNFYIPISYVDINFERANKMDALMTQKFYFRVNVYDAGLPEIKELSIKDYVCGCETFKGLFAIITQFYDETIFSKGKCTQFQEELKNLRQYYEDKCSGKIPTAATFMRQFVTSHPEYKQDSMLNQSITYDLLMKMNEIQKNDLYLYK